MSKIVIQMGHVPRTHGATGAHREQEAARAIAGSLAPKLAQLGHDVHTIGADDAVPFADIFIALHTDGSSNTSLRGGSVGYPDANGGRLASLWKQEHGLIYDGGFQKDNYTVNESHYYGFGKAKAKNKNVAAFLAEHCHTSNKQDEDWLFSHIDEVASAHVRAIQAFVGGAAAPGPVNPPTPAPVPNPAPDGKLTVDGNFGPKSITRTQQSVNRTGANPKLDEDGVFGEHSKSAVQGRLNHELIQAGKPGIVIDGDFGKHSTIALQWRVGTKQDGKWGPVTTEALQTLLNREEL
jgi:hypothetical protein